MTTLFKSTIIAIAILASVGTTSCLQGDDLAAPGSPNNPSVDFTGSSWKITYFWDSDHDETGHYNAFVFVFQADGTVNVSGGPAPYNGTWSKGSDDSTAKLYLNFTTPPDLEELSDDWHILEWTDNSIRLQDISGGNGGTDLLTFIRI